MLAWQLVLLVPRRLLSLRSPWPSTSRTRSPSPTVSPMTLSSPRSMCSQPLRASSVMGISLHLGLSLVASCNVALFPFTCSVSPIWCICLLNLSSAPPAILSPLLPWTSSTSSTCAVSVKWRLLQASAWSVHLLRLTLLPSLFPAAVNAFTTNVWLGQSTLAATTALFAHRTSSPSCLTPFLQPLSSTSTFPLISTRPLPIPHSILFMCLMACHIHLPSSPSVVPTVVDLQISNLWMTAAWNGLQFTRLPKAPRLLGFLNGSVVHAVRPLPFRTSLLFPQSRVLSALLLRLSSLTGPQDALCVSAFPVNSLSLTTVSAPHLSLLFHPRLLFHRRQLFHPTMILLLTGFRTVLFPVFHPSTVGDVVTPLLPGLALNLGSSALSFHLDLLLRSRVLVSLPTPLVTVSRFLLSNLSSGPPTHSPSSMHTPITSTH